MLVRIARRRALASSQVQAGLVDLNAPGKTP
jgi:ribosomal 50S subunit-recycling heat shock protein